MVFDYKKNRDWADHLQIITQIGLTMAGCIIFCFYVGRRLDEWLGLKGIFTIIFILLGIIGGADVVYRQIMKVTESKSDADVSENDSVTKESITSLRKKHGIAEEKKKKLKNEI